MGYNATTILARGSYSFYVQASNLIIITLLLFLFTSDIIIIITLLFFFTCYCCCVDLDEKWLWLLNRKTLYYHEGIPIGSW
jgi:hypothetical protein